LSPPGRVAKQIYAVFEGHLTPLIQPRLLELFEYMNGGDTKKSFLPPDAPTPEPADNAFYHERDLDVGHVKTVLKDVGSPDLLDWLLKRKVFRLGLRVQCPRCTRNFWSTLDTLSDELTCPKCLVRFSAAGHIDV
jgi:hypothetical protein